MSTIDNAEMAKLLEDRKAAISEKSGFARLEAIDLFNRTCHEHLPTILSALRAQEGWRLVPVEPTEAMLKSGSDAIRGGCVNQTGYREDAANVYRAMIAAAPQEAGR